MVEVEPGRCVHFAADSKDCAHGVTGVDGGAQADEIDRVTSLRDTVRSLWAPRSTP